MAWCLVEHRDFTLHTGIWYLYKLKLTNMATVRNLQLYVTSLIQ